MMLEKGTRFYLANYTDVAREFCLGMTCLMLLLIEASPRLMPLPPAPLSWYPYPPTKDMQRTRRMLEPQKNVAQFDKTYPAQNQL